MKRDRPRDRSHEPNKRHSRALPNSDARWHARDHSWGSRRPDYGDARWPSDREADDCRRRPADDNRRIHPRDNGYADQGRERDRWAPPPPPPPPESGPTERRESTGSRDDSVGHFEGQRGESVGERYEVLKDVGIGTFGRVVECWDRFEKRKVAIKVVRRIKKYTESARIEAEILRDVNASKEPGSELLVKMYYHFEFRGHCCLVFERLGCSLYDFLKANDYRPFRLSCVRDFARQLLQAVACLHRMRLIHTDLKPENVLLCDSGSCVERTADNSEYRIPVSTSIKVIDFGGATYDDEHKSSIVNTRQYRAPEVILALGWSLPSDLWSIGCIVAELFDGELLFATHSNTEHIALMERCLGYFPHAMIDNSKYGSKYFGQNGQSRWQSSLSRDGQRHVRRMRTLREFVGEHRDTGLLDLLGCLLELDPKRRATAQEALGMPFVRGRRL